jgi:DNA mismatch repair protein MutL
MSRIHVLPPVIYNQIAAGEVVERPASVVKELVENAFDAGATAVDIALEDSGVTAITVADNGEGMSREDAQTAFLSHATSKIQTAQDLQAIFTMGFRGEALSSIAAVSKIELLTRREQDEEGTRVVIEGGEILSVSPAAVPRAPV